MHAPTTGGRSSVRTLILGLALLSGSPQTASAAQAKRGGCAVAGHGSPHAVLAAADTVRRDDHFFRFLKRQYGAPSTCRGSRQTVGEGWVEFVWSDNATFRTESMNPEIFIARYSRTQGLRDPDAVIAALRAYATARGMRINWDARQIERSANGSVEEFMDPEPGLNGIVRLQYSAPGVLIGVSLSSAP